MNKSELIKTLADDAQIPLEDAESVVNIFFSSLRNALLAGDRVEIRGFGSFKIKEYEGYSGRNPKTGQPVAVIPKRLPFFRAGKDLKDFINS
ncbi:MAG: integration host factor subunit beta [Desulfovibrio sp.]|nr:integration host factor subunit beta [Desulfovibrio sp.]